MRQPKGNPAIAFSISKEQTATELPSVRFAARAMALLLLTVGFFGMQRSAFYEVSLSNCCVACFVALLFGLMLLWLLPGKGRAAWGAVAVPAALLLFCILFFPKVRSGGVWFANQVLSLLQLRNERIYLPYDEAMESAQLYALIPAAAAIGSLFALIMLYVPFLAGGLLAASWLLAGGGWLSADVWLIVFALGCMMVLLQHSTRGRAGSVSKVLLQNTVMLLVLAAAITACFSVGKLYPADTLSTLKSKIAQSAHEMRYEREKRALPEGDFSQAFRFPYENKSMLELEFDEPASLYLRGSAYAVYDENGWKPLSRETANDSAELFYWLHKNGFSGETQLSTLAQALSFESENVEITISATGACRKAEYVPSELCDIPDSMSLRDGTVLADGSETYHFTLKKDLVGQAYELLKELKERHDEPAVTEYLKAEESYREFVYENYLDVPEECLTILTPLLRHYDDRPTSYEAKMDIRAALAQSASYRESAVTASGGSSLLQELLDRGGNCTHYATAAVLMLRAYGIPARYAEGYLVTPEASQSGKVVLTGKDAHVWAEYYEDGVGWIPFETAPPFIGLMNESKWQWFETGDDALISGNGTEENGNSTAGNGTSQNTSNQENGGSKDDETIDQWENRPEEPTRKQGNFVTLLLWILCILLLAIILFLILRHHRKIEKRKRLFESEELQTAISALFADSVALMRHSGLPVSNELLRTQGEKVAQWFETESDFCEMEELNREAMFSDHEFTEAQREAMAAFRQKTLDRFCGKLNVFQRLYQRWILCMY